MRKLRTRLIQVFALEETDPFTAESARAAILSNLIAGAMAYRLPPREGKYVSGTFKNCFEFEFKEPLEPKQQRKRA